MVGGEAELDAVGCVELILETGVERVGEVGFDVAEVGTEVDFESGEVDKLLPINGFFFGGWFGYK